MGRNVRGTCACRPSRNRREAPKISYIQAKSSHKEVPRAELLMDFSVSDLRVIHCRSENSSR